MERLGERDREGEGSLSREGEGDRVRVRPREGDLEGITTQMKLCLVMRIG